MLTLGMNPLLAMLVSLLAGGLGGYITYILFRKFKIQAILAGILTMTFLYSVNLRITGTPNVTFFDYKTVFQLFESLPKIVILIVMTLIIKIVLDWFLKTEKGYLLLATGDNETLVKALGKNPDKYIAIGLIISNALAALGGALMAQSNGYADITMGSSHNRICSSISNYRRCLFKNANFLNRTTRAIIGAIIHKIIYGIALYLGLAPSDLKGITAIIVVFFIVYNNVSSKGLSVLKGKREENATN